MLKRKVERGMEFGMGTVHTRGSRLTILASEADILAELRSVEVNVWKQVLLVAACRRINSLLFGRETTNHFTRASFIDVTRCGVIVRTWMEHA